MRHIYFYFSLIICLLIGCPKMYAQKIITGADRIEDYLPLLESKRVGLVVNHTSVISTVDGLSYKPLPDSLISRGVNVKCIMAPEHGYKGIAEAGEHLKNGQDSQTGLKIYSLYGNTKKPQKEWMEDIDIIVFDMQDVGARFYTYLSTLYYVMEACGDYDKELMVLDRPNPNDYIDGPVLEEKFKSFVGIIPIPLLHGCTLGELAQMMNGEDWQPMTKNIIIVPCENWKHGVKYDCPIAPSPNLPNPHAINIYPSLCLFEGTSVSVGRGTSYPFECYGHPNMQGDFYFKPKPTQSNKNPLQNGKYCKGEDLRRRSDIVGFDLSFLLNAYKQLGPSFITSESFFDKLAGTDMLRKQILSGKTKKQIKDSWKKDLDNYKEIRAKYLLYTE